MLRFQSVVLVLFAAVTLVNRSAAQESRPVVADPATSNSHSAEEPMSIFNDKLRRFRFELEEMLVTADTAQEFMVLHQARNEPAIIGAYADPETNSLVVVGPPDTEQPVRETLARRAHFLSSRSSMWPESTCSGGRPNGRSATRCGMPSRWPRSAAIDPSRYR